MFRGPRAPAAAAAMPPGKPLQPVLKMKVDELFLCWLSDADTQRALHEALRRIQATVPSAEDPAPPPAPTPAAHAQHRRAPPAPRRSDAPLPVLPRKEEPLPVAVIPTFYFPHGRPGDAPDIDAVTAAIEASFSRLPHGRASLDDMGPVAKACGCPLYWKAPLFLAAGGQRSGFVSAQQVLDVWTMTLQSCHDDAARFVRLLAGPGRGFLREEDFLPLLQDVVDTHPGLAFLQDAPEFHSRYINTVVQRIFYSVNRSWSGRITCGELRRSSFLQVGAGVLGSPVMGAGCLVLPMCGRWVLGTPHVGAGHRVPPAPGAERGAAGVPA